MKSANQASRTRRLLGGGLLALGAILLVVGWTQEAAPQQPDRGALPKAVLDQARNEAELLEAQLEVPKAQVEEVKVRFQLAMQHVQRLEKLPDGVSPQARLETARAEVAILEAQLKVKQAEQRVAEVRLKHARQRLNQLEGKGAKAQAHAHDDWWCAEHGVPEELCSLCSQQIAERCKKAGDWCKLHDRAKSQCFKCEPKLYAKFEAMYVAKYGKKPPMPPKEEFQK